MDAEDGSLDDVPTRPMRVKILYTFDLENKTNCLARVPEVLQIPAIAIDDSNQVGVIELRQCLQALVSASPELVTRLTDGDFTIYAYDYSENDTPLVGQGLLSSALNTVDENASNKSMITGRVCKNMLAVFNNGVKETLEVKLRLVPVTTTNRMDFSKSTESLRGASPAMSTGFDPNAWNNSVQHNRTQQQPEEYFGFNPISSGGEKNMGPMEDIFGLGPGISGSHGSQQEGGFLGQNETLSAGHLGANPAFSAHPYSAPGSRAGSPIASVDSASRNELLRHQSFSGNLATHIPDYSRPDSRTSVRSDTSRPHHQRQGSAPSPSRRHSQSLTEVFYNEDGQPRKRARVMPTNWHGRSSFGSRASDLRVTAATAASMHMHRPIPKRPVAPGSNLEPPPRVPTPVPDSNATRGRGQMNQFARGSLLRQASIANSDFMSDIESFSDAIVSSPEDESPGNSMAADETPQEIPSSPPVFPESMPAQPSSPGLPSLPLPRIADSGYMSERGFSSSHLMESVEHHDVDTLFSMDEDNHAQYSRQKSQRKQNSNRDSRYTPAFTGDICVNLETPGDMNQLPRKMLLNLPPGRREGSQGPKASRRSSKSVAPSGEEFPGQSRASSRVGSPAPQGMAPHSLSRTMSAPEHSTGATSAFLPPPESRRGSLALPPNPPIIPSDLPEPQLPGQGATALPKRPRSIHRSRTQSNESEAGSPAPSDTEGRPRGPCRSGSGAQRRKIIEQKLQKSIANGEMPTFCSHCGAIETPTWRRLYVQKLEGKPTALDFQEGEGETVGVEVLSPDEDGKMTGFIVRKAMKKTKDTQPGAGFEEVVVCNPCGLWFNKFRTMRPSDKWGRKVVSRKSKKSRENENDLAIDGVEPPSDMLFTDQVVPENVIDEEAEASGDSLPQAEDVRRDHSRRRASSAQPPQSRYKDCAGDGFSSRCAEPIGRAIKSSPPRFAASQESPIELDELSAKPTRRLLFPSPRKDGEVKTLADQGLASVMAATPSKPTSLQKSAFSPKMDFNFDNPDHTMFDAFASMDKENRAPPINYEDIDGLDRLFEDGPSALFRTPRKGSAKVADTPTSDQRLRSHPKTPTPSSRKRKPLTSSANAANNANPHNHDFMTSPSSSRYFLRSTPSRLERTPVRTPGRHHEGNGHDMTPWSRQMAQMLNGSQHGDVFTSPSRQFDFTGLPTFNTPGRTLDDCDWAGLEEIMSSEFANFENQAGGANEGPQSGNRK